MVNSTERLARYRTICHHCHQFIEIGQTTKVYHDMWVHKKCYDCFKERESLAVALAKKKYNDRIRKETQTIIFEYTMEVDE